MGQDVPGGVRIAVDGTVGIDGGGKPAAVLRSQSRFHERDSGPGGAPGPFASDSYLNRYAYTEVATLHVPGWTTSARSVPLAVS